MKKFISIAILVCLVMSVLAVLPSFAGEDEIKYAGSSGLLAAIKSHTLTEAPHDQGLSKDYGSDDGSHLFARTKEGNEIVFKVSVESAGKYDITVAYTCYRDFGKFEVSLDGTKIGEFDALSADAIIVKTMVAENIELTAGDHDLKVKCLGKNEASVGTVLGIDFITFVKDDGSIPMADIKYAGSSGLLAAIKSHTLTGAPHDQGLSKDYGSDDGSHLFARTKEGNEIVFKVSVESAGKYDITVAYTCYRDFGKFEVSLDGTKIGEFDALSADAVIVKTMVAENIELTAGDHEIKVKCLGKNEASVGTVLGIDYMRLLQKSAAATTTAATVTTAAPTATTAPAATPTPTPTTGDGVLAFVSLALVALGAAAIISKRKA